MERSGLLNPNMFDDGGEIMEDKGFNIRGLTDKIGVRLNLAIFLGSEINLKLMILLLTRK